MKDVKQVLVWRSDLKVPRGKTCAQLAHSSISWLVERVKEKSNGLFLEKDFSNEEKEWLNGSFTKICVKVESEHELMELYHKVKRAGLTVHLICDAGRTCFSEPTYTSIAIGPHESSKIDPFTGHLKLFS